MGKGKARVEAKIPMDRPFAYTQSNDQIKKHIESSTLDPGQWSLTFVDQKDQDMAEPPESLSHVKGKT
jgi:hypothetical protein